MTDHSAAPSPFSSTVPAWQTAWDSTSLGWLKECPRLYQYQMLEQWSPRNKGIHLVFGGLYASAVERYAHARADGQSHDDATRAMVRWVLTETWTPDGPWETNDPIKNRYTLIRSLVWNAEDRLTSHMKTVILANGKPAVELSFSFTPFDIAGEAIHLCGHLDELVELDTDTTTWVKDDKTTKGPLNDTYFKGYSPNNQMSLYAIAGKVILDKAISGVLVRAAQIGVGFTRFATRQIPRPAAVLDEWLSDTKFWITQAREFAIAGHWPMNDKSCGNYGGCPFARVCSVSPTHRAAWLKEDFVKSEWNPLAARGDI